MVESYTPTGEWRGHRLGHFSHRMYSDFHVEANSSARRFWVKTANNEEGHHIYRRVLISNGWIETNNGKDKHVVFQFFGPSLPGLNEEFDVFKEHQHLINHIPGEWQVLNKGPLLLPSSSSSSSSSSSLVFFFFFFVFLRLLLLLLRLPLSSSSSSSSSLVVFFFFVVFLLLLRLLSSSSSSYSIGCYYFYFLVVLSFGAFTDSKSTTMA